MTGTNIFGSITSRMPSRDRQEPFWPSPRGSRELRWWSGVSDPSRSPRARRSHGRWSHLPVADRPQVGEAASARDGRSGSFSVQVQSSSAPQRRASAGRRVAPSRCLLGAPTDPDLQFSRIRLLKKQVCYVMWDALRGIGSGNRFKIRCITVHVRGWFERRESHLCQILATQYRSV
jgi:hypothetical protein